MEKVLRILYNVFEIFYHAGIGYWVFMNWEAMFPWTIENEMMPDMDVVACLMLEYLIAHSSIVY